MILQKDQKTNQSINFDSIMKKANVQDFLTSHLIKIAQFKKYDEQVSDYMKINYLSQIYENQVIMLKNANQMLTCLSSKQNSFMREIQKKKKQFEKRQAKSQKKIKKTKLSKKEQGIQIQKLTQKSTGTSSLIPKNKRQYKHQVKEISQKCQKPNQSLTKHYSQQDKSLSELQLVKNLQTCDSILFVNIRSHHTLAFISNLLQSVKLCCSSCLQIFNSQEIQQITEHIEKCQNKAQIITGNIKSIFKILKNKIQAHDLVLRKCNCQKKIFQSDQAYLKHVKTHHAGIPPPFSSHLIHYDKLLINPIFSQYNVLEEQLLPHFYFCAQCPSEFINSRKQLLQHLQNHQNKCFHRASSHCLQVSNIKENNQISFLNNYNSTNSILNDCM